MHKGEVARDWTRPQSRVRKPQYHRPAPVDDPLQSTQIALPAQRLDRRTAPARNSLPGDPAGHGDPSPDFIWPKITLRVPKEEDLLVTG